MSVQKKNYTHIFCLSLDSNPRTSKMISFCILMPKLTQPQSYVLISIIIVGVIQRKIFPQISKLCHKTAQVVMANLLACFCSTRYVLWYIFAEMRGNLPMHSYDLSKNNLLSKLEIRRAEKNFSSCWKKNCGHVLLLRLLEYGLVRP